MRKKIYIIIIVMVFILAACNKNSTEKDLLISDENEDQKGKYDDLIDENVTNAEEIKAFMEMETPQADDPEIDLSHQYTVEVFNSDESNLLQPSGIICREDDILVTDRESNCIKVFDYQGNLINEIGKIGNGEIEFISPTGITIDQELIYIIDSGNDRIVILNMDFTYHSCIEYKEEIETLVSDFTSIVILNGDIYLSGQSNFLEKIWVINKNGEQFELKTAEFSGSLYTDYENLYAMDTLEVFSGVGRASGHNNLYIIKDKQVIDTIEMPYKMCANDFEIKDDIIYVLTRTFGSMEMLNLQGEYTGRLGKIPFSENRTYAFDMDIDGVIYALNGSSSLYKIKKK